MGRSLFLIYSHSYFFGKSSSHSYFLPVPILDQLIGFTTRCVLGLHAKSVKVLFPHLPCSTYMCQRGHWAPPLSYCLTAFVPPYSYTTVINDLLLYLNVNCLNMWWFHVFWEPDVNTALAYGCITKDWWAIPFYCAETEAYCIGIRTVCDKNFKWMYNGELYGFLFCKYI